MARAVANVPPIRLKAARKVLTTSRTIFFSTLALATDTDTGVFSSWIEGDFAGEAGDSSAAVAFLFCARLGDIGRREADNGGFNRTVRVLFLCERKRLRVREVESASSRRIATSVSATS